SHVLLGKIRFAKFKMFAAELETSFPLDTQQQPQADAADHQRTAAVAQEWQCQTLGRQQADVHADIDQKLADPQKGQAIGDICRNELPVLLCPQADIQSAHADEHEQGQGGQGTDHAQLLSQDGKNKIGMRLGQVELLLDAVAQADAKPLATAKGNQRLG